MEGLVTIIQEDLEVALCGQVELRELLPLLDFLLFLPLH